MYVRASYHGGFDKKQDLIAYIKQIDLEDMPSMLKYRAFDIIISCYLDLHLYQEGEEFINREILKNPNDETIYYFYWEILVAKDYKSIPQDLYDKMMNSANRNGSVGVLLNEALSHYDYDYAYQCAQLFDQKTMHQNPKNLFLCAFALVMHGEVEQGISYLQSYKKYFEPYQFDLALAKLYYFAYTKDSLLKALDLVRKMNVDNDNFVIIGEIAHSNLHLPLLTNVIDFALKVKRFNDYALYFGGIKYFYLKRFFFSSVCFNKISSHDEFAYRYESLEYLFKMKRKMKKIGKIIEKMNNHYATLLIAYYGLFNKPIDHHKIDELLKYDNPNQDEKYYALYGNIYLDKNDDAQAISYFQKGYDYYLHHQSKDISSALSLAYCYALGKGVEKDMTKARSILEQLIKELPVTNLYQAYTLKGQLDLLENKTDIDTFNLLIDTPTFDVSRLFVIIAFGNQLKLNVKKYQRAYVKALKKCSLKERAYYLAKPQVMMLTLF
jgi:hypothetical protein